MSSKTIKNCKVEGCCVPSKKYCEPESPFETNKPDTNYPALWKELYLVLFFIPYSIAVFISDIYSHSYLKKPKRPTWDIGTTLTVAIAHAFRNLFQSSSAALWRQVLYLPYRLSTSDKYYRSSFTARKLNLQGILKVHDALEDGTREIEAQWLLPEEEMDEEDKRVVLYLHGGGYCVKDWQAFLNVSHQLLHYSKLAVFCTFHVTLCNICINSI